MLVCTKFKMDSFIYHIIALLLASLFLLATSDVYYVAPDFDFNGSHQHFLGDEGYPLRYYIKHSDKYFTTNTQLHLLPGEHYLEGDIIIQDVVRLTIIGTNTNGVVA